MKNETEDAKITSKGNNIMINLLVIDDKKDDLAELSSLLKKLIPDCNVETALSGAMGIEKAKEELPDTIFLDVNPGLEGLEVCRALKSEGSTKHIPVIMLTEAGKDVDIWVRGLELGVDAFLSKPFDEAELAVLIKIITRLRDAKNALKKTEEQLRQSKKMEAIGKLAGGLAHNFNNFLTVILGYSNILMMKSKEDKHLNPYIHYIEEIKKSAERASSITKQLLAFSQKQVLQLKVLNLNKLIDEIEKIFRRLTGEDINLITKLEPELGLIQADVDQIEQVMMNLIVYSRNTMGRGGHLIIETRNVYLDEDYCKQHTEIRPGHYVLFAVSNIGYEIEEKIDKHISNPFSLESEQHKGDDPELSTVYGMVKQSNGYIKVYGTIDHGLLFEIYLPRIDEVYDHQREGSEEMELEHGTETILLVDDDDGVRNTVYTILSDSGYSVLQARNVEEALFISERQEERPIQLLVTDIVMPGMSGYELAEKIVSYNPDMKVLYMSGYTDDAVVHHGMMAEGVPFIQKPFTPINLSHKVREVLDKI